MTEYYFYFKGIRYNEGDYVKLKFYGEAFYLMDLYPTEDGKVMFGSRNWVKDPVTIKNMIARVPV